MYIRVRDNMGGGTPYLYRDFDEIIGIRTPIREEVEKNEWAAYVDLRNASVIHINKFARKFKQNWRLKVYVHGESIIKYEDGELAHNDVLSRCRRAAQNFEHARDEWDSIRTIPSLTNQDRLMLKHISDTFGGAAMAVRGSIQSMRSLPAQEKRILIEYFDMQEG